MLFAGDLLSTEKQSCFNVKYRLCHNVFVQICANYVIVAVYFSLFERYWITDFAYKSTIEIDVEKEIQFHNQLQCFVVWTSKWTW